MPMIVDITLPKAATGFGIVIDGDCFVSSYTANSVAEEEGVPLGSQIKAINEKQVATKAELVEALSSIPDGGEVVFAIDVSAKPRPAEEGTPPEPAPQPVLEPELESASAPEPEPGPEAEAEAENAPEPEPEAETPVHVGELQPSAREVREAQLRAERAASESAAAEAAAARQAMSLQRITEISVSLTGKDAQATGQ